ncbi:tetratricopeptide repeat protein [Thiohalomonas denitrificans]|uniref:Tetratricopeptide repeat-containing protein n=1 Tax=Thiohalomonas denitrificans TaxID=415747 RepID=A0A1G5QSX6_9GAMM|nr:tetratricopeptide repeat protein [Thiohalomonas denitrificans]SCZ64984.1 Tetratricopeptide repeat-containing protein [Thiohalomonas denitrificans]
MSLINQVLKDVEARRTNPAARAEQVTPALRTEAASTSRGIAALVFGMAVAGFGGWLWWSQEMAQPPAVPTVIHPGAEPAEQTVAATRPTVSDPVGKLEPDPSPEPEPEPKTPKAPEDRALLQKPPQVTTAGAPQTKTPAGAPPAVAEPKAPEASKTKTQTPQPINTPGRPPVMEKRVRRLTAEQEAEQLYREAYTLLTRGRRNRAEDHLTRALEQYPAHARAREAFAGILVSEGRWVELLTVVERGLVLNPADGKLAQLAARAHLQQEHPEAAVAVLTRSLEAGSSDTGVAAFLAATYQKIGRYSKSAEVYRQLVTAHPRNSTWWAGLGIALEQTERTEEARQAYQNALSRGGLKVALRTHVERRLARLN